MKTLVVLFALLLCRTGFALGTNPVPGLTNSIEYYQTDDCSGALIGISDATHGCDALIPEPNATWSIRVNSVCLNIEDTKADLACQNYGHKNFANALYFYRSDNCTGALSVIVDEATSCTELDASKTVWSIGKNAKCLNIADTNEVLACTRFK